MSETGDKGNPDSSKSTLATIEDTGALTTRADANAAVGNGRTALHNAAISGNSEGMELLVKDGANINATDNHGPQANSSDEDEQQAKNMQLFSIIRKKYKEEQIIQKIEKCLDNGAEINAVNSRGKTILDIAHQKNFANLAKYLSTRNTKVRDVDAGSANNETNLQPTGHDQTKEKLDAILLADQKKTFNIDKIEALNENLHLGLDPQVVVKFLIENKIDINHRDSKTHLLAIDLAWDYEYYEIVLILLEAGSKFPEDFHLDVSDDKSEITEKIEKFIEKRQELHQCIRNNEIDHIYELIVNYQLTNFFNTENISALEIAAENANVETIEVLINLRLSIDHINSNGDTLLSIAAKNGKVENVMFFIRSGIDINHQNECGERAVELAWHRKHYDVVLLLLKNDSDYPNGFNLDVLNENSSLKQFVHGRNMLHELIKNKESLIEDIKRYIMIDKAKLYLNSKGESAIFTAIKYKRFKLYAFLKSKGLSFKNKEEEKYIKSLTAGQIDMLHEEIIREFPQVDKGHVLYLMSKSRSQKPIDNFKEFIEKIYLDLDGISEVSLIMQVLQYTDYLDIVFDLDNGNIMSINPTASQATRGTTDYKYGRIYVAAKVERDQLLGTLAHELTHLAVYFLYKNDCNPYYNLDDAQSQLFESITATIKTSTNKVESASKDEPIVTLAMAFQYPREEWHSELIVRVPHILAQYPVSGREFFTNETFKLLLDFYNDNEKGGLSYTFREFIENSYLIKPKNSIQYFNEYFDKINDVKEEITFKDCMDIDIFLGSQKQLLLIDTDSLLLSVLKVHQSMVMGMRFSVQNNLFLDFDSYLQKEKEITNLFYSPAGNILCLSFSCDPKMEHILQITAKLKEILERKTDKKIIFMIQTKNKEIYDKIASINKNRDQITHTFTLNSFTKETQKHLLEKEIVFQEKNTNLHKIIGVSDDIAKELIKATTLVKLIKGENVKVGRRPPLASDLEGAFSELFQEVDITAFVDKLLQKSEDVYIISGISGLDQHTLLINSLKTKIQDVDKRLQINSLINCVETFHQRHCMSNITKRIVVADERFQKNEFKQLCHMKPDKNIFWIQLTHEHEESKFVLHQIYNPGFYIGSKRFNTDIVFQNDIKEELCSATPSGIFIICVQNDREFVRWLELEVNAQKLQFKNNILNKIIQFVHSQDEMKYYFKKYVEKNAGRTVHMLMFKNKLLVWHGTSGSFNNLNKYRSNYCNKNTLIDEDSIVDDLHDKKVTIFAGDPGMGKSTFLVHMYSAILSSNQDPLMNSHWVIKINLKYNLEGIKKIDFSNEDTTITNEIADYLMHIDNKISDYSTELFSRDLIHIRLCRDTREKPLFLAFDGFDEVLDEANRNQIIAFLQYLKDKTCAKICITTRLHYKRDLERALSTFAIKLEPMDDVTTLAYITRYFRNRLSLLLSTEKFSETFDSNGEQLAKFADVLLNKMKEVFKDNVTEFIGTPLQLYLLLEGSERCFKTWVDSNGKSVDFCYFGNDIWEVYEKFVSKKYNIICRKAGLEENKQRLENKERFDKYHMDLAKSLRKVKASGKMSFSKFQDILLGGGIVKSDGNELDFIHPTFAEYFCAKVFLLWIKKWKDACNSALTNVQKQQYFFSDVLRKSDFVVIRAFLNAKLLKENFENVQLMDDYYDEDILFVAVKENLIGIAEFIYHSFSNVDVNVLIQYKTKLLQHATISGNLEFVNWLIGKGARVDIFWNEGFTVLYQAAMSGRTDMLQLLIEKGVDINVAGIHQLTVLHGAAVTGNYELLQLLVNKVLNVNAVSTDGYTALHLAAKSGNLESVKLLIDKGVDVNAVNNDGCTALHYAAKSGNVESVKILAENGANVKLVDRAGRTVMHYANWYIDLDLDSIKMVVKNNVDINAADRNGKTALYYAAANRNFKSVEWLVENGANVNAVSNCRSTVVQQVARHGNLELVKWLVEKGAHINSQSREGYTVLHHAASSGNSKLVEWLVDTGANVNATTTDGWTVLHDAAKDDNFEILNFFVGKVANINAASSDGVTPLHVAARAGNLNSVKRLLETGANRNVIDRHGKTVLHNAAMSCEVELIKWLVRNGANINATDSNGSTALHLAAHGALEKGCVKSRNGTTWVGITCDTLECWKWMVVNGANVNAMDKYGRTILHEASRKGVIEMVQWLVKMGADVNLSCKDGTTVLQEASKSDCFGLVKWLVANGADINAANCNGRTVLHDVAMYSDFESVEWLVKNGANIHAADDNGRTALHDAAMTRNLQTVKWLIKNGADVNAASKLGLTVIQYAAIANDSEFIKWLVDNGANINFSYT